MPFDGSGFTPEPPRRPGAGNDTVLQVLVLLLLLALFVMPISLATLADLVRYLQR